MSRAEIVDFINMNKTSKHREYEAYQVQKDSDGKGTLIKTENPQCRFEKNTFYLFQVFKGEFLVSEWALYDWNLTKYRLGDRNIISLSIEKSED